MTAMTMTPAPWSNDADGATAKIERACQAVYQAVKDQELDDPRGEPPINVMAPLSWAVLADAFGILESRGRAPGQVRMNPRDYADVRKWAGTTGNPYQESLAARGSIEGIRGGLWDVPIITDLQVEARQVFVLARMAPDDMHPDGLVQIEVTR